MRSVSSMPPGSGTATTAMAGRDGQTAATTCKCKLCGRTVPVRRDNLKSVLDVLDANGEPSISLAALAARLPRGKRH